MPRYFFVDLFTKDTAQGQASLGSGKGGAHYQ